MQKSIKLPKWPLTVAELCEMMKTWPQDKHVASLKITLEEPKVKQRRSSV